MASVTPSPTPNPDAMKYTLDVPLPAGFNYADAAAAAGDPFASAIFDSAGDSVASLFAVNDFVTVTRRSGADWGPITAAVEAAAAEHL